MNKKSGFSMLLKLYRKNNCYTQVEAAKHLGYSSETIKAWECGKRFPIHEEFPRLAHLMGITPQELEQTINTSRLDAYIQKVGGETALVDEALHPSSFLPLCRLSLFKSTFFHGDKQLCCSPVCQ